MKQPHAVLAFSLLAVLVAGRVRADDPPPAPAKAEGEKIRIVLTPKAGDRFANEVTAHTDVSVMGMEQAIDLNMLLVTAVDSVAADGTFALRNRTARVWGKMTNPMLGDIEFDSDKPAEKAEDGDQMAAIKAMVTKQFSELAGKETVVTMSADGTAKVDASAPGADQASKAVAGLGKLPDKPVGVGDSWDSEIKSDMQGMTTKIKMKNTVKAFDADTITVEQTGTMEISGDGAAADGSNPMAAMMSKMKTKSSSMKGTIKISRKDGMTIGSDSTMDMEMSIEGEAGQENPMAGMSFASKTKTHQERKPAPPETPAKPAGELPAKEPPAPAKPATDGK